MKACPIYLSTFLVCGFGCGSGAVPAAIQPQEEDRSAPTGIQGTAYRGPTRPVCLADQPCKAAFSAGFEIWQGGQVVTRFRSDTSGRFLVHLAPGSYTVAADSTVGILIRSQTHPVTVGPKGLTRVELNFDTGIR